MCALLEDNMQESIYLNYAKGYRSFTGKLFRLSSALLAAYALSFSGLILKANASQAIRIKSDITIELSKDACWYTLGSEGKIFITLRNETKEQIKGVTLRVKSHRRLFSRTSINNFFQGKESGAVKAVEYQDTRIKLIPGSNKFTVNIRFDGARFSRGIYPVTVEALSKNGVEAQARTAFVLFSQEELGQYPPLNIVTVLDIHPFPNYNPDGVISQKTMLECLSKGGERGWLSALVEGVLQFPDTRPSICIAPYLLEELEEFSKSLARKEKKPSDTGQKGKEVAELLEKMRFLASRGVGQFLLTPYALPNLEIQWNIGWQKDAKEQISLGASIFSRCLKIQPDKKFFFPPGLTINSEVAADLGEGLGDVIVLSSEVRNRSKKLLSAIDENSPQSSFMLKAGKREVTCFIADKLISGLINRVSKSNNAHQAAQSIAADLAALFLENPGKARVCTLVWSVPKGSSADVILSLLEVLSNVPWVNNLTLQEASALYENQEKKSIEIPLKRSHEEISYFPEVGVAREAFWKFYKALSPNERIIKPLRRNLFIAQSDIWRQSNAKLRGLEYASYVNKRIREETAKISFEQTGMITLTGGKPRIPLTVRNYTGYRVKAMLELSCEGISFPEGSKISVTLEPKENLFEIPVRIIRKGKLTLRAVLNSEGLEFSKVEILVHTGRYSVFAIAFLGAILFALALLSAIRVVARRRAGKHKSKKRKKASEN